ncbi:unnamed protein product [Dracunculus medinensis]|uniref:Moesin/ezrin/radixin homolog 1 n=1 Tax=Dracunculus medinensis TaxID=318479 RepID=A0A0N4UEJ1_DRAME|nr:unnamed protein product [Dracunculus medinensis]
MGSEVKSNDELKEICKENVKKNNVQEAKVTFLDATQHSFFIKKRATGGELFNEVVSYIHLNEKEYFSLSFGDNTGTQLWLCNDKRISKQLKGEPWIFNFRVKFYPVDPTTLNDDLTRYQMCLQIRSDIYSGKISATFATYALLGSYIVQSEFGDYSVSPEYDSFLRNIHLAPVLSDALLDKVQSLHKQHKGQSPADADLQYLENAKKLSLYGISTTLAKDSKGNAVAFGIGAHGIHIYQDRIRIYRFIWQNIIKIAYKRNIFTIKLRRGELEKNETNISFKFADYETAKRAWKFAVENHTFFRLIRPDEKPRKGFLHWGSGKFSYQGRTQFQSKMASQMFGNSAPNIQRSQSARFSCKSDGNGAFFNLLPMLEIYIESENFLLIKSISHNTSHFIEFNLQRLNFL